MKNSADLGGCYPPQPSASVDNTLLDLQNSSYSTQPHSIIANNNYIVIISTPFYNPSLLLTGIFPDTNFPKVIQKVGLFSTEL